MSAPVLAFSAAQRPPRSRAAQCLARIFDSLSPSEQEQLVEFAEVLVRRARAALPQRPDWPSWPAELGLFSVEVEVHAVGPKRTFWRSASHTYIGGVDWKSPAARPGTTIDAVIAKLDEYLLAYLDPRGALKPPRVLELSERGMEIIRRGRYRVIARIADAALAERFRQRVAEPNLGKPGIDLCGVDREGA